MDVTADFLHAGDIITFPKFAQSEVLRANTGAILYSQGVPGFWKVSAIRDDGTVTLERVPDEPRK